MFLSTRINVTAPIRLVFLLWFTSEILAFLLVVHLIGFAGAVLVGLITTLFGWTLLKRTGRATLAGLMRADGLRGAGTVGQPPNQILDTSIATIGAVALLLPGFVTDVVGLLLSIPRVRDWVGPVVTRHGIGRLFRDATHGTPAAGGTPTRDAPRPRTIDLDPVEWHRADTTHPTPRI